MGGSDSMSVRSSADRIPIRNPLFLGLVVYTFVVFVATFCGGGVDGSLSCSPPPAPVNGIMSPRWDGYAIQFKCNQGFVMIGATTAVCRNGAWNHPPPVCRPAVQSQRKAAPLPSQGPSQYSLLRSLSDRQYQHDYNMPVNQAGLKLSTNNKRPLFSWDATLAPQADAPRQTLATNTNRRPKQDAPLPPSSARFSNRPPGRGRSFSSPETRSANLDRNGQEVNRKSRKRKNKKLKTFVPPPLPNTNVVSNSYFESAKVAGGLQVTKNSENRNLKTYDTLQHIPVVSTELPPKTNVNAKPPSPGALAQSTRKEAELKQEQYFASVTKELPPTANTHVAEANLSNGTIHAPTSVGDRKNFKAMSYDTIDVGQLDMTCVDFDDVTDGGSGDNATETPPPVEKFLTAPLIVNGSIDVYRRRHNPEDPFNTYLEVFYVCDEGYHLRHGVAHSLYCLRSRWVGELPMCLSVTNAALTVENRAVVNSGSGDDDADPELGGVVKKEQIVNRTAPTSCAINKGGCSQECHQTEGTAECRCYRGYQLNDDSKTCSDINECEVNNGSCQYQCWNIPGSYLCFCPEGHQLGSDRKSCMDKNECLLNNGHGPCQDVCVNAEGGYQCSCTMQGTQLSSDNHTCEDIDECVADNFGCSHSCLNTIGSAFCTCADGYMLGEDWKTCEDIDECQFPELAQSCSGDCINTLGSYKCSGGGQPAEVQPEAQVPQEELPQSSVEAISLTCESGFTRRDQTIAECVDVNECELDNFGCSHVCINAAGSASCSCPDGYSLLEDWKTCDDVDECSSGELNCAHQCVNVNGSAHCACNEGFRLLATGECQATQCSAAPSPHLGELICNSSASKNGYYVVNTKCQIRCPTGFQISGVEHITCTNSGSWDSTDYNCTVVEHCPALEKPRNGNVEPESCWNGVNLDEDSCRFTCDKGYTLVGEPDRRCSAVEKSWNPPNVPICEKVQIETPFVECPPTVTAELPLHRRKVLVHLTRPRSNVPATQMRVFPAWVRNYEAEFPPGLTLVTFQAVQVETNLTATCGVHVNILDRQPPFVYNCPRPITTIEMPDDQPTTKVSWQEPIFQDNVGIVYVWKSREPGEELPAGVYHVQYVARDAAGNTGNCGFTIQVATVPSIWAKA